MDPIREGTACRLCGVPLPWKKGYKPKMYCSKEHSRMWLRGVRRPPIFRMHNEERQ